MIADITKHSEICFLTLRAGGGAGVDVLNEFTRRPHAREFTPILYLPCPLLTKEGNALPKPPCFSHTILRRTFIKKAFSEFLPS